MILLDNVFFVDGSAIDLTEEAGRLEQLRARRHEVEWSYARQIEDYEAHIATLQHEIARAPGSAHAHEHTLGLYRQRVADLKAKLHRRRTELEEEEERLSDLFAGHRRPYGAVSRPPSPHFRF